MADAVETETWTAPRYASAGGTLSPIVARVRETIVTVSAFDFDQIRPASDLVQDLGFDELNRVDLAICLESEFGIEISDAEAQAWATAGDVAACVRDRFMQRSIP